MGPLSVRALVDFLALPLCAVCGEPSETLPLCAGCSRRLDDALEPLDATTSGVTVASAAEYPDVSDYVKAFKYGNARALRAPLGALMARALAALGHDRTSLAESVVVPLPAHSGRRRERGYCQTTLLARSLAAAVGARFAPLLARVRYTEQQARCSEAERAENVAGAFTVRSSPRSAAEGASVLLVDDVVTTGSTMAAAAEALGDAGAESTLSVCVARQT